jgi:hypothetical protein
MAKHARATVSVIAAGSLCALAGCGRAADGVNGRPIKVVSPSADIRRIPNVIVLGLDRGRPAHRAMWTALLGRAQDRGVRLSPATEVSPQRGGAWPDAVAVITPCGAKVEGQARAARRRGIPVFAVGETRLRCGQVAHVVVEGLPQLTNAGQTRAARTVVDCVADYIRGLDCPPVVRGDGRAHRLPTAERGR